MIYCQHLKKDIEPCITYKSMIACAQEIKELKDKLSRRNMQIRELKKRITELETFNQTFGDKRDYTEKTLEI